MSGPNDRTFTKGKIASRRAHPEASVERHIDGMVRIDRQQEGEDRAEKVDDPGRRHARVQKEIRRLQAMEHAPEDAPDGQISLTDPDARAMATSARNSGTVGYSGQDRRASGAAQARAARPPWMPRPI